MCTEYAQIFSCHYSLRKAQYNNHLHSIYNVIVIYNIILNVVGIVSKYITQQLGFMSNPEII